MILLKFVSIVIGNMSGLLVGALLSLLVGFKGPFAFIGGLSLMLTLFLNVLIKFVEVKPVEKNHMGSVIWRL